MASFPLCMSSGVLLSGLMQAPGVTKDVSYTVNKVEVPDEEKGVEASETHYFST